MPRRPRIENIGFHHIINRGVARSNIFLKDDDFKKFLTILEDAKLRYDFVIHSFCLMNNHYHLLLETKTENLSLIARQINSKYAQYFNKEYKRVGPLWQGRFKNSFVYDDVYLSILLKYIEQNPIKANMIDSVGKYRWSSSFYILNNIYDDLLSGSMLYDEALFTSLSEKISDIELEKLDKLEKTKYKQDKNLVRLKQQPLESYFNAKQNIKTRNIKIKEAVLDGYKQSEIADFLKLSRTSVSKIIKTKVI
jgi:REP element-mobilizing transposase RayT/predicted XRE-type DNA-binding protein